MTTMGGWEKWILDVGERVVFTWLASAVTWLSLGQSFGAGWVEALAVASVPPVLVVIMSAVPQLTYGGTSWGIDVAVRALRSAVQAGGALIVADAYNVVDATAWRIAAMAGLMAALAVAKGALASRLANTITPASFAPL